MGSNRVSFRPDVGYEAHNDDRVNSNEYHVLLYYTRLRDDLLRGVLDRITPQSMRPVAKSYDQNGRSFDTLGNTPALGFMREYDEVINMVRLLSRNFDTEVPGPNNTLQGRDWLAEDLRKTFGDEWLRDRSPLNPSPIKEAYERTRKLAERGWMFRVSITWASLPSCG
ncbi:hypothetical protein GGR58DRAFT_159033 [Xylaria digitata]|nr:hypothetical protein GGR58DRAFT_159033 [Xylaria digitata]